RRRKKWSARRIARELADGHGFACCVRTVTRWLDRLGLNRIGDITPDGENLRSPGKITARYPGHMVHMDVKKVGQIPDGGGWRAHGRGSEEALAGKRAHKQKVGYTYLHSMEDGYSRLSYTESLEDEKAVTTIGFFHRARAFFAAHGITWITRLVTDNGSNYTASAFRRSTRAFIGRHQRTRAHHRSLPPRPRVLRRPRHHLDPPVGHRQRQQLPSLSVSSIAPRIHRPPPAHQGLHAPPQRKNRALPADPRRRMPLRPPLHL